MTRKRIATSIAIGCTIGLIALIAGAGLIVWAGARYFPQLGDSLSSPGGRGASSRGEDRPLPPPNAKLMSQPADPWRLPTTPSQGTLLVLPFVMDGLMNPVGNDLAGFIIEQWSILLPDGVAIADPVHVRQTLASMSPYAGDKAVVLPMNITSVVGYVGATHWVEGIVTEANGEWIVEATLHVSTAKHERRFAAPVGEHYTLTAEISGWIAAESGFQMTEEERADLGRLPLGPELREGGGETILAMRADADHPKWAELLASPHATVNARVEHAFALVRSINDAARLRAADPGPLPSDAPLWQRKVRRMILTAMDERVTAQHEVLLMLARHPGHGVEARRYLQDMLGDGEMRLDYVEAMQRWHQRAPATAMNDALYGNARQNSAWDYRGTGYAETVSARGWEQFRESNQIASDMYRKAIAAAGPIPSIAAKLATVYGAEGNRAEMIALHRATIAAYPDYGETWTTMIYYTLPRWGGSAEEVALLIDEAMASRPDNCAFGHFPMRIYYMEAQLTGGRLYDLMIIYAKTNPKAKEQILRGIERMGSEKSTLQYAAKAVVGIAMVEGNADSAIEIVRRWPEVHHQFSLEGEEDWYGIGMFFALYSHINLGNWKAVDELMEVSLRDDAQYEHDMNVIHNRIVGIPGWQPILAAYADIMNGRLEAGLARLDAIANPEADMMSAITFLKLFAGRVDPGVRELCDHGIETKPEDAGYRYIAALAAHRLGDSAAARSHIEEGEKVFKKGHNEGCRREVRKLALGEE